MFLSMVITFAIFLITPFKVTLSYFLDLYKLILKNSKMWFWIKPRFELGVRNREKVGQSVVKVVVVLDVLQDAIELV